MRDRDAPFDGGERFCHDKALLTPRQGLELRERLRDLAIPKEDPAEVRLDPAAVDLLGGDQQDFEKRGEDPHDPLAQLW